MTDVFKKDAMVDPIKITTLKNLLEDSFSMLMRTFIEDTEIQIVKLIEFADENNYTEIRNVAHSMKGASANMGAIYLNSLACSLEEYCKKEDYQNVSPTIQLIQEHYPVLKSLLEKFLP